MQRFHFLLETADRARFDLDLRQLRHLWHFRHCKRPFPGGRKDIVVTVQLGIQVAGPARRFPTFAPGSDIGILEHHIERRIAEHAIEVVQRLFHDRIEYHHHRIRRRRADIRLGRAARVQRCDQFSACFRDRRLRALARGTRAREQDDALSGHEPEPSPTCSTPSNSNTLRISSTSWYGLPR